MLDTIPVPQQWLAEPAIRRQINQGFFEKLCIDEDGKVARADLREPFAIAPRRPGWSG
jgi:hypothetical protein